MAPSSRHLCASLDHLRFRMMAARFGLQRGRRRFDKRIGRPYIGVRVGRPRERRRPFQYARGGDGGVDALLRGPDARRRRPPRQVGRPLGRRDDAHGHEGGDDGVDLLSPVAPPGQAGRTLLWLPAGGGGAGGLAPLRRRRRGGVAVVAVEGEESLEEDVDAFVERVERGDAGRDDDDGGFDGGPGDGSGGRP